MITNKNKESIGEKKKFHLPHIYVLLFSIICVCAIATWILPAGEFTRAANQAGKMLVVPGTYKTVTATPVAPFQMFKAIYKGMVDAAGIVFFVFMAYASIGLMISTGAFNGLVAGLIKTFQGRTRTIIIPAFIALLGSISSTIGCFEEMFPFIPIFVGIAMAMGYDAIVGLAIVALGVGLGYSGAAMNPFTVGMAQSVAGLPPLSGVGFRIFCHVVMVIVASAYTIRYALRIQADPTKSFVYGTSFAKLSMTDADLENHPFGLREKSVLLTLLIGIIIIVYGTKEFHWYFEELCAVFLIMGLVSSLIMGWSANTIAEKIAKSFSDIAMACMMIGIARGILVVLTQGHVIDTVVYGLSIPLATMPTWLAGEAMLIVQTLLNFLIPSGSGQAVVSMPIMAPLADLLGISRQIAVLAYQFGDGLSNVMWPTAFAPVICGIAGVKLETWWKWFTPLFILLVLTQMILIAIGIAIGF